MAERINITIALKKADFAALDREILAQRLRNPAGRASRASILRSALSEFLHKRAAAASTIEKD